MLDSFDVRDLLPGVTVRCRSGAPFKLFPGMPLARFLSGDYAGDLTHKSGEADLDLMQVRLPSGAVLWERKEEPVFVTCIGCALEPLDKDTGTCMICLRGGHKSDIDFYRPAEGGATNEKE